MLSLIRAAGLAAALAAAPSAALAGDASGNAIGAGFSAIVAASLVRPANTTTYTVGTGWNNAISSATGFFSFPGACRVGGAQVLIPQIDITSSANPTLKLAGVLYLFAGTPGTLVSDNAAFTIAAADFAKQTGNVQGFPFTLANGQTNGAANSGVSLTGATYHGLCPAGSTTITGMVQVTDAYIPVSGETLTVQLHTVGAN